MGGAQPAGELTASCVRWRLSRLGRITDGLERQLLAALLCSVAGKKLPDVGCGDGAMAFELARHYFTATNDYTKGAGTYLAYYNLTLKDGSALWFKVTGSAKPDDTTTIFPEAPVSVLRGTGRFEGVKGDGTFTGQA